MSRAYHTSNTFPRCPRHMQSEIQQVFATPSISNFLQICKPFWLLKCLSLRDISAFSETQSSSSHLRVILESTPLLEHHGASGSLHDVSEPKRPQEIVENRRPPGKSKENPSKICSFEKKNMFTKNRKIKMLDVHTTFTSIRNGRHFGDAKCAAIEKNLRPGVDDES